MHRNLLHPGQDEAWQVQMLERLSEKAWEVCEFCDKQATWKAVVQHITRAAAPKLKTEYACPVHIKDQGLYPID